MKAFKLILTTLLFLASFAAEAQNVVIYKDGNIVREYTAEQVDSVVYVPAKEVKYYYYVGTERPTVENLATIGTSATEPVTSIELGNDGTVYKWFVYPDVWGKPTFVDPSNNMEMTMSNFISVYPIETYTLLRAAKTAKGTLNITWK